MRGVNKVIIVGTLGADPEAKQFANGGSVTRISVATSEQWTDKQTGERRESTEWHRISLFNRLGEIAAQYLRKGSQVYIEGSLRTNKYTDQNGIERYATEIRADQMQMLGAAGGQANQATGMGNPGQPMYNHAANPGYQNNQPSFGGQQANPYGGPSNQSNPSNQGGFNQNNALPQPAYGSAPAPQPQTFNQGGNQFANNAPAQPATPTQQNQTPKPGAVDDDIPF